MTFTSGPRIWTVCFGLTFNFIQNNWRYRTPVKSFFFGMEDLITFAKLDYEITSEPTKGLLQGL